VVPDLVSGSAGILAARASGGGLKNYRLSQKRIILLFVDWYSPGYKAGGPITSCVNLVEHLSDEFEFRIVTRNCDYTETEPYPGILPDCWIAQSDGNSIYYFSSGNLTAKNVFRLMDQISFDEVYFNSLYSLYFTLLPLFYLKIKRNKKQIILATRGMLAESAIRVKKAKKKTFLSLTRFTGLFRSVVFHATNEVEKLDIERTFGKECRVMVAGNLSSKSMAFSNPLRKKAPGSVLLVSIARIAPEKNLEFALSLLKNMKGGRIQMDIYGPIYDKAYWARCQEIIPHLPKEIVVNYMGSIPSDEVQTMLSGYHFLFMPTLGENFGHIILQAMGVGCPVIISDRTPWRGLKEENCGWDIPLSRPEEFEQVLKECIGSNQEAYDQRSQNAFEYANRFRTNSAAEEDSRKLFRRALVSEKD
jgi:glycosyltransferase involved in cell wall biosynthesis